MNEELFIEKIRRLFSSKLAVKLKINKIKNCLFLIFADNNIFEN